MADLTTQNNPEVIADELRCAAHYQAAVSALTTNCLALHSAAEGYFIDFGAGHGDRAHALMDEWGIEVLCVEPDRRLHRGYAHRMPRCADLSWTRDCRAHGAYSIHMFEHVPKDVEALRDLARKCRAGSFVFIMVPANPGLWTPLDSVAGHHRRYSPTQLRELVVAAGLTLESEGWFDRTGYVSTRLYQLLRRVAPRIGAKPSWLRVKVFDLCFRLLEPMLAKCKLPFGRSCWVLARTQAPTNEQTLVVAQ